MKRKDELLLLDEVEVYKMVLQGDLNRFPHRFWIESDSRKIVKYLIEEVLHMTDDEIKTQVTYSFFKKYRLGGMANSIYGCKVYDIINHAYPNRFKPWEMKNSPMNTWNRETAIEATKWMIEEKLQWNEEDIKDKLTKHTFIDHGLIGMVSIIYKNSIYDIINDVYPNKFKPWEMKNSPSNTWDKETAIKATKWMIEEKLKWNEEDIKDKISKHVFKDCGLRGMLMTIYNESTFNAINDVYPGRFKKWELRSSTVGKWTDELTIEATKWMIEEKLKWTEEDIKNKLTKQIFNKFRLSCMIRSRNNSIFEVIDLTYPNKFNKNDFKSYNKGGVKNV